MSHPLRTRSAAVATHHPLATQAGAHVLRAGGNAIDAAVAAMNVLCVIVPGFVGFGGYGGSMVIFSAETGRTSAIDFDSRCPIGYCDDLFTSDCFERSNFGYLAVSVPGIIAGLAKALRQFGTQSWADVSQQAIELAENGVPMEEESRRQLEKWQTGADPISRKALFPDGQIPELGQLWVRKGTAEMLRQLADQGPQAFYHGEIPRRICRQIQAHGGILSEEDFARYEPAMGEPVSINYRGHDLYTPPPPSGGVTSLQILKTLEQFDLANMKPWSAPYLHLVSEACKLCFADRRQVLGDPDFVKMPLAELLSSQSALQKAEELRREDIRRTTNPLQSGPHTSNVSVIDADGNVVSLTATQGYQYGSRVVIEGLELVMGHGMSRFDFAPDHPNRPAPGKRMQHNMSPMIILKNAQPYSALGLPGGTKIITVTAQLVVNLIDFHCTPREAVYAPRVHSEGPEPICVSGSLPPETVRVLEAMGHQVRLGQSIGGAPNEVAGPANIVLRDDAGHLHAASSAAPDAACVLAPA
jgi:gamma-glutamyltranspeptidase/glutathione hydrolase